VIFFRGDGQYRSKIGLSPSRARSIAGSYDDERRVLTLVQYTRPTGADEYVNSMWEVQREPFKGDVINSYNDGPPAPGSRPLARFTNWKRHRRRSPLAQRAAHPRPSHFHLMGPAGDLDRIARATLGAGLEEIRKAFE
jgi:hypothetical protein